MTKGLSWGEERDGAQLILYIDDAPQATADYCCGRWVWEAEPWGIDDRDLPGAPATEADIPAVQEALAAALFEEVCRFQTIVTWAAAALAKKRGAGTEAHLRGALYGLLTFGVVANLLCWLLYALGR